MNRRLQTVLLAGILAVVLPSSLLAQELIPLVNPSFEEAGGTTPCTRATDFADVPGWNMDGTPADSGVSDNADATDGVCAAWLFSGDPQLWQFSDVLILGNKTYTLEVDARSSWMTNEFEIRIVYDWGDTGVPVTLASAVHDFEGISEAMTTLTVSVNSDDHLDAWGWKIGVAFKNTTTVAPAWANIDNVRLTVADAVANEDGSQPNSFVLAQNYPNPFNPATTIAYELKEAGSVRLTVHDALGRTVRTLVDGIGLPGEHEVSWDGRTDDGTPARTGIYLYRLTMSRDAGAVSRSRAMLLLR